MVCRASDPPSRRAGADAITGDGARFEPRRIGPTSKPWKTARLPSTFTVTNLLDSGAGSLRAAVASANANPGPDAIDFATTGTIALTSGQLDITDSLTISGPGVERPDRQRQRTRPQPGLSGIAGNPTVSIANLTVANGRTASADQAAASTWPAAL